MHLVVDKVPASGMQALEAATACVCKRQRGEATHVKRVNTYSCLVSVIHEIHSATAPFAPAVTAGAAAAAAKGCSTGASSHAQLSE